MTRYLPVPALWWFPEAHDDGPRRIVVPAGTAVHATHAGRVTDVDDQAVGSIVVRDEQERFHHYRRLRASSITVAESDEIEAGAVIGVVAEPNDGSVPAVLYGVHDADDRWIDIVELLAVGRDPDVLVFDRVGPALANPTESKPDEFAGPTPAEPTRRPAASPTPVPAPTPAPAVDTAPTLSRPAAPEQPTQPVRSPPTSSAAIAPDPPRSDSSPSDSPPSSKGEPAAASDGVRDESSQPAEPAEPAEPDKRDEPDAEPQRSRLAARRRPRRPT